jgi:hypothetical protein
MASSCCWDSWIGSWKRIFCPGFTFGGHVTMTRWPLAMSAKGWPAFTPSGTVTSNIWWLGAACGPRSCCGSWNVTRWPDRTPRGHVTITSWLLIITRNCCPGFTFAGTVTTYCCDCCRGAVTMSRSPCRFPSGHRTIICCPFTSTAKCWPGRTPRGIVT